MNAFSFCGFLFVVVTVSCVNVQWFIRIMIFHTIHEIHNQTIEKVNRRNVS